MPHGIRHIVSEEEGGHQAKVSVADRGGAFCDRSRMRRRMEYLFASETRWKQKETGLRHGKDKDSCQTIECATGTSTAFVSFVLFVLLKPACQIKPDQARSNQSRNSELEKLCKVPKRKKDTCTEWMAWR